MTIDMDWSPDFCLACDRQTPGGVYCSQACRLADIEKASNGSWSEPSSPTSPHMQWTTPNPFDFARPQYSQYQQYQQHQHQHHYQPQRPHVARSVSHSPQSSTFMYPVPKDLVPSVRPRSTTRAPGQNTLSPSSSRSSLSSIRSQQAPGADQFQTELRSYASSFDKVRVHRRDPEKERRMTMQ